MSITDRCRVFGPRDRVHVVDAADVQDAYINTMSGEVFVEEHAFFGHEVMVLTGTHPDNPDGDRWHTPVPHSGRDIHIKEGVWVASRAIIIASSTGPRTIGAHAVIGAGAVVSMDVPPYAFVAGNPAKIIKYLYPDNYTGERNTIINKKEE